MSDETAGFVSEHQSLKTSDESAGRMLQHHSDEVAADYSNYRRETTDYHHHGGSMMETAPLNYHKPMTNGDNAQSNGGSGGEWYNGSRQTAIDPRYSAENMQTSSMEHSHPGVGHGHAGMGHGHAGVVHGHAGVEHGHVGGEPEYRHGGEHGHAEQVHPGAGSEEVTTDSDYTNHHLQTDSHPQVEHTPPAPSHPEDAKDVSENEKDGYEKEGVGEGGERGEGYGEDNGEEENCQDEGNAMEMDENHREDPANVEGEEEQPEAEEGEHGEEDPLGGGGNEQEQEGSVHEADGDPFDNQKENGQVDEEPNTNTDGQDANKSEEEQDGSSGETALATPEPTTINAGFRDETQLDEDDRETPTEEHQQDDDEVEKSDAGGENENGAAPDETIEMEGEPQTAEASNAKPDTPTDAASTKETAEGAPTASVEDNGNAGGDGDPFDPLSGETESENIVVEGVPESEAVDESTNGFLDKVNSGSINSAQFMPAIIDLPEKKRGPRGRPAGSSYKKRKRADFDSDSDDDDEEFEEYTPHKYKPKRKPKPKPKRNAAKNKKTTRKSASSAPVRRRTTRPRDAMFECFHCDFRVETIGELNIHTYGNHDSEFKPTFLDMAEATIAKLSETNGTSRLALLKTIMADYGHVVEVNTATAKKILNRSLKIGMDLGRLRPGIPGKKGANNIHLPSKDSRKALLNKFLRNPDSLFVDDLAEDPEDIPLSRRQTKNSGGRGRPPAKAVDDDEICVVEEKLTPLAKMKAKAYANAKAALAKKLPAAFLKAGATKMVRIGPGGIVRAEGGKIVTTLGKLTGTTLAPITKKKVAAAEQEARHQQQKAAAAAAALAASEAAAAAAAAASAASSSRLDDDDDDLTCHMCLSSFWYRNELLEHMKNTHNIENPEKHLKSK